mgnify:CR=1 FL=1
MKGIKKEVVERTLSGLKIDEGKIAKELLARKVYKWKNLPIREARQKMGAYLARKGFGWEVIGKLLKDSGGQTIDPEG